jgi:hypothetical protein
MHRENDANHVLVSTTTALHNALRPCNLHSPLSLRINAIVNDHIAVAVALVFAKLSFVLELTELSL